ncbi:MAG: single-stranded DNA-binding protein [Solirubrobacteraceae bacterium]
MSAPDLNHVTLSGRLARSPVLETLASGHVVCSMVVACHYRQRDDLTGAWREFTDYVPVRAFGFQARTAKDGLRRGSLVSVVGRVASRRLAEGDEDDGRWVLEVIAQAVQFAGGRRS